MPKKPLLSLAVVLLFAAEMVAAQNMLWLDVSPVRFFNDRDWQLWNETADEVLEAPDGTTLEWNNPESGNSGRMTARSSYQMDGHKCRLVRVENRAGREDLTGGANFNVCHIGGEWKIVGPVKKRKRSSR